jgi:quercetin dioxygenase-like cupin family protein
MTDLNHPEAERIDLFGPSIQFLTVVPETGEGYCLMKGTLPPGATVPLHTHLDRETFYVLSGRAEVWKDGRWHPIQPGMTIDIPGGARHAFRNVSGEDATMLTVTTMEMGRFFRKLGRPYTTTQPGPPSAEEMERFVGVLLAAGHWFASPEENLALGIRPGF